MAVLGSLGMSLSPGIGIDQLLITWSREQYENRPYDLLISMMGTMHPEGAEEVEEGTPIGQSVLWFDTECLYDHGDYVRILKRVREISCGHLLLEEIRDYYDYETGVVWIEFELDRNKHRIEPRFNGDWFDMNVLARLSELLQRKCPEMTLAFQEPEDQTATIWYTKKKRLREFFKKTGIRFHPF